MEKMCLGNIFKNAQLTKMNKNLEFYDYVYMCSYMYLHREIRISQNDLSTFTPRFIKLPGYLHFWTFSTMIQLCQDNPMRRNQISFKQVNLNMTTSLMTACYKEAYNLSRQHLLAVQRPLLHLCIYLVLLETQFLPIIFICKFTC